jgi:uncharacterized membrane protein (UPF0127 family)
MASAAGKGNHRWRLEAEGKGTIATDVAVADGMWSRFMGLMGTRELPAGHGLCLKPCSQIHMFFMRFPIDAVFIDGDGRVVRCYPELKPWRVTRIVSKAKACLELPAGSIATSQLQAGDVLRLVAD